MKPEEVDPLMDSWVMQARDNQYLPEGNWRTWLMLAGRGFGKTRAGAETVKMWIEQGYRYINIIGATTDNARDIMIEGESGIMSLKYSTVSPHYMPSKRCIEWSNGARTLIFTADSPEMLRGKQSEKLFMDEIASWKYPESYDQAMFGLRLGNNPQAVITTTPRPIKIIKELIKDPTTHVTRGTTYDNKANLAPAFLEQIITKYEGTRLGRQELNAEILDDNPNALWNRTQIDELRLSTHPELKRIVVGVDPAVTSKETSAETGIIVCGVDYNDPPHGYVLDDRSIHASPDGWARRVVAAYHEYGADRIIAEVNNGGEMVVTTIRTVDKSAPVKPVHATRGKAIRAEPISALYEQSRVHHVGSFPELEDEMCNFDASDPNGISPDRMDALVWAFTELMTRPEKTWTVA